jgi:uncharacterized protein YndB with AHSA1/START domain
MRDIFIERDLPYPPALVWEALTESNELAAWLMPNDFKPLLDHAFTFKTDPAPGFDGTVHCRITALEPPRRLVMTWKGGPLDTVLDCQLVELPTGTRLSLRHSGFKGLNNVIPRLILGAGWKGKTLSKLGELLAKNSANRRNHGPTP